MTEEHQGDGKESLGYALGEVSLCDAVRLSACAVATFVLHVGYVSELGKYVRPTELLAVSNKFYVIGINRW